MSIKIATVVGARPQFIKAAAFSRKLKEMTDWTEVLVHTGQHYDVNMSGVFFKQMEIPQPDYHLEIHSMPRRQMIEEMRKGISEIIEKECPDMVLVYGDTNSTLAGALAAKEMGIKLAHVEAGLRSYNDLMPEELNRAETDLISDFLFVPAQNAVHNLTKEGISADKIFVVGDIMHDAVNYYSAVAETRNRIAHDFYGKAYVLATIHRQENTDEPGRLKRLFAAIDTIAKGIQVIMPLHPRTKRKMEEFGITTQAQLSDPVGYFDMLLLIKNSDMVMTDSGGLQKEAYYLGKFCITLREETEWIELVNIGANKLCGADLGAVEVAFTTFKNSEFNFTQQPYGQGDTGEQIIVMLKKELEHTPPMKGA